MVQIDCKPVKDSARNSNQEQKPEFQCFADTENIGRNEWFEISDQVPPHTNVKVNNQQYRITHEPWETICFSDEGVTQCKDATEVEDPTELERIAEERTREIEQEEGWDRSYYYSPSMSGEPYGYSVFVKEQ